MATSRTTDDGNKYSAPMIPDSLLADDSKKWREKVPVGVRFKPKDEILVDVYLKGKVYGSPTGPIFQLIKEVEVYKYQPSQLPRLTYDFGDGKMYLFSPLIKKNENGSNVMERNAPGGFWRKTGIPSYVKVGKNKKPMAMKTTLVYYKKDKNSNPVRTQWLMKEYMLDKESEMLNPWTLCVVYQVKLTRESERYEIRRDKNKATYDAGAFQSPTASDDKCPEILYKQPKSPVG